MVREFFFGAVHPVLSKEPVESSTSVSTASLDLKGKDFAGWSGLKQLADEGAMLSVPAKAGFKLKNFGKSGQIIIKMSEVGADKLSQRNNRNVSIHQ